MGDCSRKWGGLVLGAFGLVVLITHPAGAALYSIDKDPNDQLYGHLDQDDVPVIGNVACAPAATVNSFVYLENRYPTYFDRLLIPDANENGQRDYSDLAAAAATLAAADYMNTIPKDPNDPTKPSGTWDDMMIYGKWKYLQDVAPGRAVFAAQMTSTWGWQGDRPPDQIPPIPKPAWVQDNTTPDWMFLYEQLTDCQDVEILINWPGGGHVVTVSSFRWNDVDEDKIIDPTEGAWIDYIDPQTGAKGVSPIWNSGGLGSLLEVGYGTRGGARVNLIVSQSVPEPAGLTLMAAGVLTLLARRRRRRASAGRITDRAR